MKKKEDKLEQLTAKFKKASDKRLAKLKKEEERWLEKEKAANIFDEHLKNKIITVFRPVMKQLTDRLPKELFRVKVRPLGSSADICESYDIESVKEKGVYFWVALLRDDDTPLAAFSYGCAFNYETDTGYYRKYKIDEVDEQLITKIFIRAMSYLSR